MWVKFLAQGNNYNTKLAWHLEPLDYQTDTLITWLCWLTHTHTHARTRTTHSLHTHTLYCVYTHYTIHTHTLHYTHITPPTHIFTLIKLWVPDELQRHLAFDYLHVSTCTSSTLIILKPVWINIQKYSDLDVKYCIRYNAFLRTFLSFINMKINK